MAEAHGTDRTGDEAEPHPALSDSEKSEISDRKAGSSRVIHEVIRIEGEDELARPWMSLMFSGLAGGVAINASVLGEAYLHAGLPDAPWRPLVEAFGYTLGFIIVVMARMQLFTESTVTAVLPVATDPNLAKLGRMSRLWAIVFASNMAGTFAVSLIINSGLILSADHRNAVLDISRHLLGDDFWHMMWLGIPSGFLVGSMAWILPNARASEIWVILFLSYLIALGGFSHVIAGSTETWMLWLTGQISFGMAVGGILLPSLIGNIIGGTGLFAVLAHGQVRDELSGGSD